MDLKRCFTPHALLHNLMGLGIGLILVALIPSLGMNAMMLGIAAVVVAMVADAVVVK